MEDFATKFTSVLQSSKFGRKTQNNKPPFMISQTLNFRYFYYYHGNSGLNI